MSAPLDITVPLARGTAEWPGDTPFDCGWHARIAEGSSVNLTRLTMSPHVATHADAPMHVREGAPASEMLPVDAFIGAATVVVLRDATGPVTIDELTALGAPIGTERILLRTGASIAAGAFPDAWRTLAPDAAAAYARGGLRLLGVDAPSVDARTATTLAVHHALFDGGAFVLENLDLRAVAAGRYTLTALPLRIIGADAAPVRALLTPA
ncbi:MAG: cyclase family protein [Gemmatimonadaceae bacterium]|nr:cyclase family protein [Gemmatimonadaceae bacterium]